MMRERNGSGSEMNGQGVFAWADITSSPACSSVAKGLTEKDGSEEMGKRRERLENQVKKRKGKKKMPEAVEPNVLCNLEYSAV